MLRKRMWVILWGRKRKGYVSFLLLLVFEDDSDSRFRSDHRYVEFFNVSIHMLKVHIQTEPRNSRKNPNPYAPDTGTAFSLPPSMSRVSFCSCCFKPALMSHV